MYPFDTSSLINLVKRGTLEPLAEGCLLDLAVYESLDVVWKECRLLRRISEGAAWKLLRALARLFEVVEVVEEKVFQAALKRQLTTYDASHIAVAMERGWRWRLTIVR